MTLVLSLILGGILGEAINFEKWFDRRGKNFPPSF
jgi:uncharacterized membrane protein YqgA involved in biofilm formation